MILSGGKKIDPLEVEAALFQTQMVKDCIAFAVPHPVWGEAVGLAYIPKNPSLRPEPLKQALRPLLSSYKIPKVWYRVSSLPFNDRGKLNKRDLKLLLQGLPKPISL